MIKKSKILYNFIGHKGRVFDIRYSIDESKIISASEDGKAIIWDLVSKKSLKLLNHSDEVEILRVCELSDGVICCCLSNGQGVIWTRDSNGEYNRSETLLDHQTAQIYACERIQPADSASNSFFTAADDTLRLWDVSTLTEIGQWLTDRSNAGDPSFGGERNPENMTYIFDAKASSIHPTLVSMALSDGTVRVIDVRIKDEFAVIGQPGRVHATAVCQHGHI
jgi:WD40 repeat protein